ncbi:MAG: dihydroorotase, partial [Salegentibacter sp.]
SDHNPIDIEHKKVEFENAMYGSIGPESAFGALNKIFSAEDSIDFLTRGKQRFSIPDTVIKEGEPADLSLFDPATEYSFEEENILSTSKNSIFLGSKLKGKALGIVTKKGFIAS